VLSHLFRHADSPYHCVIPTQESVTTYLAYFVHETCRGLVNASSSIDD